MRNSSQNGAVNGDDLIALSAVDVEVGVAPVDPETDREREREGGDVMYVCFSLQIEDYVSRSFRGGCAGGVGSIIAKRVQAFLKTVYLL